MKKKEASEPIQAVNDHIGNIAYTVLRTTRK